MWWQAIVVALAAFCFPTAVLLFFIGGPQYRDEQHRGTLSIAKHG